MKCSTCSFYKVLQICSYNCRHGCPREHICCSYFSCSPHATGWLSNLCLFLFCGQWITRNFLRINSNSAFILQDRFGTAIFRRKKKSLDYHYFGSATAASRQKPLFFIQRIKVGQAAFFHADNIQ